MTTYAIALVNITDGTVQGHKAGCADLKRGNLRKHADDVWEFDVADKAEAWFSYNSDFLAEGGIDNGYEIEWAPCAKHVPAGDRQATYDAAFGITEADIAAVDHAVHLSTPAGAFEAAVAKATVRRTWNATAAATHRCAGACGEVKPAVKFPTTKQAGRRGVECRSCRDARR